MEIFEAIYVISVISAMILPIFLGILDEIAQRRGVVAGGGDIVYFYCLFFWVTGPIAVIVYLCCIAWVVTKLIKGKKLQDD